MIKFIPYNKIDYSKIKDIFNHSKVTPIGKGKKKNYWELAVSFDTETTSTYITHNDVKTKFAFTYLWQFGIASDDNNLYYCYGRSWKSFIRFCKELQKIGKLSTKRRLIIYIHNFSYEFQFMRKYFKWIKIFATKERTPVKALCSFGIEFRDSLILSGYKLAILADNLTSHKIPKLVGDLDYTLIRNGATKLSKKELAYSLNDVRILIAYILEQRQQYKSITKIPLTNTQRVRRFVRKKCFNKGGYRKFINTLTIDSPAELALYKQAFAGGFTHANPHYTGKKMKNIASIDFTSSYPTVMVAEKYPMSRAVPQKWTTWKRFNEVNDKALQIFTVEFWNLKATFYPDNYISKNKCIKLVNQVENNGRIFSADYCKITVTSVDWSIIKKVYTADRVRISNQLAFYKGYLPKPIIESVLDLYGNKTKLKHVKGKEAEYLHAKGMLNSCYGMAVTAIVHDTYNYTDNNWHTEQANIKKSLTAYNKNYNRFLFYPWGIFVTAYARRNLWTGLLNIKNDYLYSDTDSIKFKRWRKHLQYVRKYNKEITAKLEACLNYYHLDKKQLAPLDIYGKPHPLGCWDLETGWQGEHLYKYFKTLGAKRYIWYNEKDGLNITIAGLPKIAGKKYLLKISHNDINQVFQNFTNKLTVPADYSNKMVSFYGDDSLTATITDYQGNTCIVTSPSFVHLEKTGFTLSMSQNYLNFLTDIFKGEFYNPDQTITSSYDFGGIK